MGVGAEHGGYPARLVRRIEKIRPVRLHNLGVSGATSSDVLRAQLPRLTALAPELITLGIGVNDLWRMVPRETLELNLLAIAKTLGSLRAKVFVCDLPDLSRAPIAHLAQSYLGISREQLGEHIAEVNQAFYCFTPYSNITLVGLHGLSQSELEGGHAPGTRLFSADGFHPSDAGYERWARLLWREMAKAGVPNDLAA